MGPIRKLFKKNFEKRSANWSEEKKTRRLAVREKAWKAIEVASTVGNIASAGKVKSVLNLATNEIDKLVADTNVPEFDVELGDILKQPIMRKAMELAQEFIDIIEANMNIDIPDELERRILQRSMDALSDLYDDMMDSASDQLEDAGVKIWAWFKDLFD